MPTLLKLGPADHGRPISLEELLVADQVEGFNYELIEGKVYVSPLPNPPENHVEEWIWFALKLYARDHPKVINFVSGKSRVFVPENPEVTAPEPDVTAYHNYPYHIPVAERRWQDVSPILVAEVISHDDPEKDTVRNVRLYFAVPSIKEYWLLDNRADAGRPTMTVHRRYGGRWRLITVGPDETYTPKLLPGFSITMNIES